MSGQEFASSGLLCCEKLFLVRNENLWEVACGINIKAWWRKRDVRVDQMINTVYFSCENHSLLPDSAI